MSGLPNHISRNRAAWDRAAAEYAEPGRGWATDEPRWGVWHLPESELSLLPDVSGLDVIELGCGTAYVSAWLCRRGARVTGIDNSRKRAITVNRFCASSLSAAISIAHAIRSEELSGGACRRGRIHVAFRVGPHEGRSSILPTRSGTDARHDVGRRRGAPTRCYWLAMPTSR